MTDRCRKPNRHRVTLLSVMWALLSVVFAVSCRDSPAEPDASSPPSTPVRPELAPLRALYESTNGREWHRRYNWLTDAPVETWTGVTIDEQGRVSALNLAQNNLSGEIPAELADLTGLERLQLNRNDLSGPIPAELGKLVSLKALWLDHNGLSGSIPPELGRLVTLEHLRLQRNELSGEIPAELENLASLLDLWLIGNDLIGSIPAELGGLTSLARLGLQENRLSGPIPPELGNLGNLRDLLLDDNDLSGSVPPEFGQLVSLSRLSMSNNPRLTGPLPASMIALSRLSTIEAAGTALCAPVDRDFQAWMRGVSGTMPRCLDDAGPTTVYLTQAVQSRSIPVPLVADRTAWLRVFVTVPDSSSELIPPVRATFYVNGAEAHTVEIPAGTHVIPTTVDEGRLETSANAEIPGEIIRPGLELVVQIDPEGTLDAALGVARRIPETGRLAVDVRGVPELNLTLIPFLWSEAPDSMIVETIAAVAADPERHALLRDTRKLLPVASLRVTAHEPVASSSNNAHELLSQTATIWTMEGGTGHYMGMMSGSLAGPGGVAARPGRTSFARPSRSLIAHELGHNMSLRHAPCGDPSGVDQSYPHADGSTGAWGWGYVLLGRRQMVSPRTPDLMSYCPPRWISGYHFTKALGFRILDEGVTAAMGADAAVPVARSLLLWGGVDAAGAPFLEPAFVVDAPSALPEPGGGAFELAGRTAGADVLFSLGFDMPEIADADGASSFAFLVPVETHWAGDLAAVTLSGPGGTATLDGDTDRPMVILRTPRTGQVRAFLRDPPSAALAGSAVDVGALSPERGLEALFSRGLPAPREWHR